MRYGGEEFLIILPETDTSGARILAERLCRAVANETISIGSTSIKITASFGGISVTFSERQQRIPMDTLINQADEKLYISKRNGRNQVLVEDFLQAPSA